MGIAIAAPGIVTRREMQQLLPEADLVFEAYHVPTADLIGNRSVVAGGLQRVAASLSAAEVDLVVLVGVAPTVAIGAEREHELRNAVESMVDQPVVIAMDATLAAFTHLRLRSAAVIAPLGGGMETQIPIYFSAHGIETQVLQTLGLPTPELIHGLSEQSTVDLARRAIAAAPDASALYAFGGGLPSLGVLALLQGELARPVFSSNTATAWIVRQLLRLPDSPVSAGALFP